MLQTAPHRIVYNPTTVCYRFLLTNKEINELVYILLITDLQTRLTCFKLMTLNRLQNNRLLINKLQCRIFWSEQIVKLSDVYIVYDLKEKYCHHSMKRLDNFPRNCQRLTKTCILMQRRKPFFVSVMRLSLLAHIRCLQLCNTWRFIQSKHSLSKAKELKNWRANELIFCISVSKRGYLLLLCAISTYKVQLRPRENYLCFW